MRTRPSHFRGSVRADMQPTAHTCPSYMVWVFALGLGALYVVGFSVAPTAAKFDDAHDGFVRGMREEQERAMPDEMVFLPEEARRRARAAVLGAFVADAASMPLHWIYDTKEIQRLVGSKDPAFHDPPACPYYQYELGALSPYGDEAYPLLESLVSHGGLKPEGFAEDLYAAFTQYKGRLNSASKEFMRNMRAGRKWPHCGASNDQAHCLVKVPLVVARYAGSNLLEQKMEEAIRVHQDDTLAVEFGVAAAKILEKIVLGTSIRDTLAWVQTSPDLGRDVMASLKTALQSNGRVADSLTKAVARFGKTCHLPGSFQGPIYSLLVESNFTQAVRDNIMAGGDSCSRGGFIAACFAAEQGTEAFPSSWTQQVKRYGEIEALVDKLVAVGR